MVAKEIVSFKGTRQGILMSISEEESFSKALRELEHKFEANRDFFTGSPISLDLGWREIEEEDLEDLLSYFEKKKLKLLGVISTSLNTRRICENRGLKVIIGRLGLADHHGSQRMRKKQEASTHRERREEKREDTREDTVTIPLKEIKASDDTIIIRKTLRSGQSVEYYGNVVIMGDINPGAEVKAGRDLIVLGALRGIAHAGLRNYNGDSVIIALKFQPTQVRISDCMINKFDGKLTRGKHPVIVSLKNGRMAFELYT